MIDNLIGKRIAHAEIKLLLDYSHQLYQKYLKSNKKFIYASILRKVNARLYERLHDSIAHLKDGTHSDALKFMIHLDVWMTIWDSEYEKKKPQLSDTFTFRNHINFPKSSVENLLLDLADFSE
jgi:hypothetical protein